MTGWISDRCTQHRPSRRAAMSEHLKWHGMRTPHSLVVAIDARTKYAKALPHLAVLCQARQARKAVLCWAHEPWALGASRSARFVARASAHCNPHVAHAVVSVSSRHEPIKWVGQEACPRFASWADEEEHTQAPAEHADLRELATCAATALSRTRRRSVWGNVSPSGGVSQTLSLVSPIRRAPP